MTMSSPAGRRQRLRAARPGARHLPYARRVHRPPDPQQRRLPEVHRGRLPPRGQARPQDGRPSRPPSRRARGSPDPRQHDPGLQLQPAPAPAGAAADQPAHRLTRHPRLLRGQASLPRVHDAASRLPCPPPARAPAAGAPPPPARQAPEHAPASAHASADAAVNTSDPPGADSEASRPGWPRRADPVNELLQSRLDPARAGGFQQRGHVLRGQRREHQVRGNLRVDSGAGLAEQDRGMAVPEAIGADPVARAPGLAVSDIRTRSRCASRIPRRPGRTRVAVRAAPRRARAAVGR